MRRALTERTCGPDWKNVFAEAGGHSCSSTRSSSIDVDAERVISVVRVTGRSAKFGTEIDAVWAWLITVGANGLGIRVETFTDKSQALEAAGLRE